MASLHDSTTLKDALVILGAAGLVIPAFHSLRISPVIGFILVGMVAGPFGLGALTKSWPWLSYITIEDPATVGMMAEFGIVLLLFMIGLELSFERLRIMRNLVFGLGSAQLLLCAGTFFGLALLADLPPEAAAIIGVTLALSSTALVLQLLSNEGRLVSGVGRGAFAILLFQDLAMVPILFTITAAGRQSGGDSALLLALVKGAAAVIAIIVIGRILLLPLLRQAARTRSPEIFLAATLLVVIGTSLVTAAAGMSLIVGALLAGLLLAETEYRRQLEAVIDPFKGLLLGVFLISIGMNLDLARVAAEPLRILGLVFGFVAVKAAIVTVLLRISGQPLGSAIYGALLIGPASELSFVVLTTGVTAGLVGQTAANVVLIAGALSLAITPLVARLGTMLERRLQPGPIAEAPTGPASGDAERAPVIIIGFGRVGQMVAGLLEQHDIPYIAADSDADVVAMHRAKGKPLFYGDVRRLDFLRRLDLDHARALVITTDAHAVVEHVVQSVRAEHPNLLIVARARDAAHAARLYKLGATDAVPETVEASLQLAEAVLVDLGRPMGLVIASVHEKRAELRAQIQALVPNLARTPIPPRRRLRDAAPSKRDEDEKTS